MNHSLRGHVEGAFTVMLPALLIAAYVFFATALAARATRPPASLVVGKAPPRQSLARPLVGGAAAGALVHAAGVLLGAGWSWLFAVFAFVLFARRIFSEVRAWRRFYRHVDQACTSETDAFGDELLALGRRPHRAHDHRAWVARILFAAVHAHRKGRTERAVRWLGAIDLRRLHYAEGLTAAQFRVACALALGRIDVARETLLLVPDPVQHHEFEEAFAILRALVSVIGGDASEARLAAVRSMRRAATGQAAEGWAAVEAHLLAAIGDEAGAEEVLRGLADSRGLLEGIAGHGGPASALARRIASEFGGAPYRQGA